MSFCWAPLDGKLKFRATTAATDKECEPRMKRRMRRSKRNKIPHETGHPVIVEQKTRRLLYTGPRY